MKLCSLNDKVLPAERAIHASKYVLIKKSNLVRKHELFLFNDYLKGYRKSSVRIKKCIYLFHIASHKHPISG